MQPLQLPLLIQLLLLLIQPPLLLLRLLCKMGFFLTITFCTNTIFIFDAQPSHLFARHYLPAYCAPACTWMGLVSSKDPFACHRRGAAHQDPAERIKPYPTSATDACMQQKISKAQVPFSTSKSIYSLFSFLSSTPSSIPAFCGWPIWSRLPVSIHKVIIDTAPSHGCPPMNTLSCSDALPVSWGHKKPTCLA